MTCKIMKFQKLIWHNIIRPAKTENTLVLYILAASPCNT